MTMPLPDHERRAMTPSIPDAHRRFPQELSDLETVLRVCERWGYGNVMDVIAQVWAQVDPHGALTVGPCRNAGSEKEAP
jgi:hypothetical protein